MNLNFDIAYLFDLDGVLIDSETQYSRIWDDIDRMYPTKVNGFSQKIKGTTLDNILSTYFPVEVHDDIISELYRRESDMKYEYCDYARDLLIELKSNHVPTAIVTSSNEKKMKHLFQDIPEINSLVSVIIDASMISRSKPDPEGYILASKKLDVDAEHCVVIEDSIEGITAGKEAGMKVVGLTGTLGRRRISDVMIADRVIDSLCDLDTFNLFKD